MLSFGTFISGVFTRKTNVFEAALEAFMLARSVAAAMRTHKNESTQGLKCRVQED